MDAGVVGAIRRYIDVLRHEHALDVRHAVLFGSFARGQANEWSDIDVVVVAPRFDGAYSREDVTLLWRIAARSDSRIQPIPCGEYQWAEDDTSAIIEIARREGQIIVPDASSWRSVRVGSEEML